MQEGEEGRERNWNQEVKNEGIVKNGRRRKDKEEEGIRRNRKEQEEKGRRLKNRKESEEQD